MFVIVVALWCVIYTFCDGGFSDNGFNTMLNLGLFTLLVLGAYKIYTEFVTWQCIQSFHLFYLTVYIDLSILLNALSYSVMFIHHETYRVYTIIVDVSHLPNQLRQRTHEFHLCSTPYSVYLCSLATSRF